MKYVAAVLALVMSGCVSNNDVQVREAIKKDPKIVFDAIEQNPEQFMDVVNRAAKRAQEKGYEEQAKQMQAEQEADMKNPKQPKFASDRRLVGPEKASIVIVEYADFQCPACGMAHKSLKKVKEKYAGQVQFVYKHYPLDFHKQAMPSALYFEAVRMQGREKAAKYYDLLFEGQRELSESFLKKAAKEAGADMARLEKDVKSEKVKAIIEEDMKEFNGFGFTGTPVMIVNGVAMQGAQPPSEIERVIQATKK